MRSLITPKLKRALGVVGLPLAALLLAGCGHLYYADPNPSQPYAFPQAGSSSAQSATSATAPPVAPPSNVAQGPVVLPSAPGQNLPPVGANPTPINPRLPPNPEAGSASSVIRVGDTVTVTFLDLVPPVDIKPQRIGEDGKITLPYYVTVVATGKTPGQLQDEIRTNYVPRYFVRMTPIVKTDLRFYFVGGEVKNPSRQQYEGDMTVLKAIDTAGGFGEFANRKKVQLYRSNGEKHVIDVDKARKNQKFDLPVYANDQVYVARRGPWGL